MTEWHEECDHYRICAECPRRDICDGEDEAEKLLRDEQAQREGIADRLAKLESRQQSLWDQYCKLEDRFERMVAAIVRVAEEEE